MKKLWVGLAQNIRRDVRIIHKPKVKENIIMGQRIMKVLNKKINMKPQLNFIFTLFILAKIGQIKKCSESESVEVLKSLSIL